MSASRLLHTTHSRQETGLSAAAMAAWRVADNDSLLLRVDAALAAESSFSRQAAAGTPEVSHLLSRRREPLPARGPRSAVGGDRRHELAEDAAGVLVGDLASASSFVAAAAVGEHQLADVGPR